MSTAEDLLRKLVTGSACSRALHFTESWSRTDGSVHPPCLEDGEQFSVVPLTEEEAQLVRRLLGEANT